MDKWSIKSVDRVRGSDKISIILHVKDSLMGMERGVHLVAEDIDSVQERIDTYFGEPISKDSDCSCHCDIYQDLFKNYKTYEKDAIENLKELWRTTPGMANTSEEYMIKRLDEPASKSAIKRIEELCETLGIEMIEGIEEWSSRHVLVLETQLKKRTRGLENE